MFSKYKEYIILQFKQYKDILIFMLIIVAFHAFWKIGREADETGFIVYFYGIDLSDFFIKINSFWTTIVYDFVVMFKSDYVEKQFCLLHYPDTNTGLRIIWGCSGLKEIIMTTLVIIAAPGNRNKKLWYIPIGILFVLLLNFIRLSSLTLLVHHHMDLFDFVHKIVFRFVMYGGIFLVWLVWTEKRKK